MTKTTTFYIHKLNCNKICVKYGHSIIIIILIMNKKATITICNIHTCTLNTKENLNIA